MCGVRVRVIVRLRVTLGLVRVRVRVMVKVKVKVKVRFRVQKYLGFDPLRHSEPFIWETYRAFSGKVFY